HEVEEGQAQSSYDDVRAGGDGGEVEVRGVAGRPGPARRRARQCPGVPYGLGAERPPGEG
ncbi:hypothetical protein, partial [Streptomyces sp. NPDC048845]|uniref:hypothetical protein n=1 Tax=Streptomyces sp. NPDC048845 TaxID=3155390 RepID=UPI003419CAD4